METRYENGVLTVGLPARIHSENAAEVEKELFALMEKTGAEAIVLDASDTEYISSAGLRVLLRLKKAAGSSRLTNVSPVVYDILNVTGFTEMIDVERAIREISVEGCEVLGEGGFGIVYRMDEDTIVKLYKSASLDTIKRQIEFAKKAFIKGVPTAISYDIVKCGDQYGVVFELVRSDTLANRLKAEPDKFDEYMDKYVELVRRVNATDFSDVDCPHANASYYSLFERTLKEHISARDWAVLTDIIASVPERQSMIHGDMHARNIMVQDGELLLIDMDELMRGHPICDIADIYYIYQSLPRTGRSERYLNMDADMCAACLDAFIKRYFAGYDAETLETMRKGLGAFATLRGDIQAVLLVIAAGNSRIKDPKARIAQLVQVLKKDVLPYRDEIAAAVKVL